MRQKVNKVTGSGGWSCFVLGAGWQAWVVNNAALHACVGLCRFRSRVAQKMQKSVISESAKSSASFQFAFTAEPSEASGSV